MTRLGIATTVFALALCSGLTTAAAEPQESDALARPEAPTVVRKPAAKSAPRYFIDFRSRWAVSYGHTFVVFGRVGEKLTPKNVAGLHPRGDSSITYMIGHVLPVQSDTGASEGDLDEQYMTARYRVMLTAAKFHAVVGQIRELQANSPTWHATTYNCNAFVGDIAQFVGLKSPPTLLWPEDFINSLRRMNGERQHAAALSRPGG